MGARFPRAADGKLIGALKCALTTLVLAAVACGGGGADYGNDDTGAPPATMDPEGVDDDLPVCSWDATISACFTSAVPPEALAAGAVFVVTGAGVRGDRPSECATVGPAPSGASWTWAVEHASLGSPGTLALHLEGISSDLFAEGTSVTVTVRTAPSDIADFPGGVLEVFDDRGLVALVAAGETVDLGVEPGALVCYGDECGDQSEMVVSDGSTELTLGTGESGTLGDLTVTNGYFRTGSLRDCEDPTGPEFLIGAYRTVASAP